MNPRELEPIIRDLRSDEAKLFWIMFLRASYADGPLTNRGELIDSLEGLADRSNLSIRNVRTCLNRLSLIHKLITLEVTSRRHKICIVNYSKMQDTSEYLTNKRQTNDKQTTRLEEVKQLRREEINSMPPPGAFDVIWGRYPKKDGRKAAERHFKASVKAMADFLDIQRALDNYLKSDRVKNGYVKNGSTWFNDWRDWINYTEEKNVSSVKALPLQGPPVYAEIPESDRMTDNEMKQIREKAMGGLNVRAKAF
jgi:hypothetical protein